LVYGFAAQTLYNGLSSFVNKGKKDLPWPKLLRICKKLIFPLLSWAKK